MLTKKSAIVVFIILTICLIIYLWKNQKVKIVNLSSKKLRNKYQDQMKQFEQKMSHWYPLGNDHFRIDHGKSYFKFFERMGEICPMVGVNSKKDVVCTGIGVLRKVPKIKGKVWYIGDVKVDPEYRKQRLPFKMIAFAWYKIFKSSKIYGISMNEPGKTNRMIKLSSYIPFIKLKPAVNIVIFSLSYEEMQNADPIIRYHRGPFSFISLRGIKDIILKSTNKPMNLLHMQFNNKGKKAEIGATHMFCCPENDPMIQDLKFVGITSQTTATVIQRGMDNCDWKFILTSDI